MSEKELKEYIELEYSLSLPRTSKKSINELKETERGKQILGLYSTFFPIYVISSKDNKGSYQYKEMKIQTLKSYKPAAAMLMPNIRDHNDVAASLARVVNTMGPVIQTVTSQFHLKYGKSKMYGKTHQFDVVGLLDYKTLMGFEDVLAKLWLENAKSYLDVGSYEEVIILVKAFDSSQTPIFKLKSFHRDSGMALYNYNPCNNEESNLEDINNNVCGNKTNLNEECAEYCQAVERFQNVKWREKIRNYFQMGYDELSLPFGTFQFCGQGSDSNSCWKKVTNDKGVCYSTILSKYCILTILQKYIELMY